MAYKNETYYGYMNTLNYKDGVFYDKGKRCGTLREELEKAYGAGRSEKEVDRGWVTVTLEVSHIIFWVLLLLVVYTGVLAIIWTYH